MAFKEKCGDTKIWDVGASPEAHGWKDASKRLDYSVLEPCHVQSKNCCSTIITLESN